MVAPASITIGGDLTVDRLGFGALHIAGGGSSSFGPPADKRAALALLRRAVEAGVQLIDTADSYGPAVSETLIAEALHPYPKGLVIATKGGLTRPSTGRWDADGRPAHLREACEASLKRLKLERIDLYQLHTVDPRVPLEDSVGALAELKRQGKIRHIGVSNFDTRQLARARKVTEIVSVQNLYNLGDRSSDRVIDVCERDGLAFLPWYPLHGRSAVDASPRLRAVAQRHKATTAQIVLAWLLRRSPAMLPIPGTSQVAHFEENWAAREIALSDEDYAAFARS
ncbi:MAG TPA: aldo/keto reductase [Stellaceae bacterium]|nr:aldo/keto reductase [Stellaceae bacterium]